jgi:beta-N-acetylhexosaminidase
VTALRDKIGQMFLVGLTGEELARDDERFLEEYPFGGFIFFSHNLKSPEQILSFCRSLWEKKKELPLFIAIDEEGGRVHRLPAPFTHFPPAAALGRTADPDLARRVGRAIARELSSVGINLDFAPVLDVHSNPDNPVIGDRSLSSNPEEVIALGWAFAQGLRAGGVIPCGKHFPGHGDTAQDSHFELPVVKKTVDALMAMELAPFRHACQNQIESLMTAHVLYPALDPEFPATLSPAILQGLLRRTLGYRGVLFSDDLEMKAISAKYGLEEAALLGVAAGADALLFCHDAEKASRALDLLCRRAEEKSSLRERVEESYARIRELKLRRLSAFSGVPEKELKKFIGTARHRQIIAEIQGSR